MTTRNDPFGEWTNVGAKIKLSILTFDPGIKKKGHSHGLISFPTLSQSPGPLYVPKQSNESQ